MSSKMAKTTVGQKGELTVEKDKVIVKDFETHFHFWQNIVLFFQGMSKL